MGCGGSKPAASTGVAAPVYYTKESLKPPATSGGGGGGGYGTQTQGGYGGYGTQTQGGYGYATAAAQETTQTSSPQISNKDIAEDADTFPEPEPDYPHGLPSFPNPEPNEDDGEESLAPSIAQSVITYAYSSVRQSSPFPENYDVGTELGSGAFAVVFLAQHKASGADYAVKKIDRSKMVWGDRDALADEIDNLTKVREGPHIVQLYEVYEEVDDCYLVMELMQGGELFDRIIEKRTFTEKEARDVVRCLLEGLAYMHGRKVVHRDLKPENLLLATRKSDTNIKLADFGFAKTVKTRNSCRTLCGTPGYLAPEILERWPAYDRPCDMWSVGVIMFLLLGGYLPFDDDDEDEVFDQTRNGDYDFHPEYWGSVSENAKELVTMFLTINPTKRVTARSALDHSWMQRAEKSLKNKPLNVKRLRQSIVVTKQRDADKAKMKFKTAVNALIAADRVNDRIQALQDGFNHYLETRSDSMSTFKKQSIVPHSRPVEEEGSSGQPFSYFYEMGDMLGEGGFAQVKRAKHRKTGQLVAVKEIDRTQLQGSGLTSLDDEIASLKILRGGPHIVRLLDVFQEQTHTYLIMEEMKGGELLQRIVDKEVYTEREARELCKILFSAVDYCHKKKIAHRDLKPENLLLAEKGHDTTIKIADFGFAKKVMKKNSLKTLCGTASYVAPEVLDLKWDGYDERADLWSVGVIVYILLGGYAPFEGPIDKLAAVIIRGKYEFHPRYWSHVSPDAKDLIKQLLQVNPNLRISAEEALQSEWMIVEAESLITRDLTVAQTQISKSKVRGAVNTIIAANRLNESAKHFTNPLGSVTNLKKRQSVIQREASAKAGTILDSSSGKTFSQLYDKGRELGKGTFSLVFEGTHKQSQITYAVKSIKRSNLSATDAVAVQDEITALQTVAGCPQIVKLFDIFDEADASFMVLECMRGGELIDRIIEKASYTEADAKDVAQELLLGVKYCHDRKIANRNLKPENLLLVSQESDTEVKISDFGYAKKVLYPNSLRTQCGTEGYVAPEILAHRPQYDLSCDMWGVGVVLYIILGGYRPFRGSSEQVMKQIRYAEYEFHDRYWRNVSYDAKELISRMLTVDPEERITAAQALESKWILSDDDELTKTDLTANLGQYRDS